jgi:DNA-binding NarL/FixJ family response regulator
MGISVLIADQERTFADAIAAWLEAESDIEVVGAVQVTMRGPWPIMLMPADVVVLDGDLPGEAANRWCEELSGRQTRACVVTLSSSSDPARIVQAILAGAVAWVRKDESLEHLLRVIHGVLRGEIWLPRSETGNVIRLLLRERDQHQGNERLLAALTPRERAVLACLHEGAGSRGKVAEQLHLSVNTVRTHLQSLMAKLGVHSALEAVAVTRNHVGPRGREAAGTEHCDRELAWTHSA